MISDMKCKLISLAACAAAVLGCGGADDRAAWFAGTWAYATGDFHCTDPGAMAYLGDATGSIDVMRVDADRIKVAMAPGCDLDFVIGVGYVASVVEGRSCRVDIPALGDRLLSIRAWRLSVGDPGTVAREMNGAYVSPTPLMLNDANAAIDGCSGLTLSGNLARPN